MFKPTAQTFTTTQLFSGTLDNGDSTTITVPQDAQFLVFKTNNNHLSVAISDVIAGLSLGSAYSTGILINKDASNRAKSHYYDRYTRIEIRKTGTALKWKIYTQGPYEDNDKIKKIYAVSYAS